MDSTTISTSIKLTAWALGKYSKGAAKMHTLLDLRESIPANIHITDGKWHDSNELDMLTPEPFASYVMDKAYVDLEALFRFHRSQASGYLGQREHEVHNDYGSRYSVTEVENLIRISALERCDLRQLLTKQDSSINSNQNVKDLSLFDNF